MKKVVSITQCASRLQYGTPPAPLQGIIPDGGSLDGGRASGRRGIVLEFPQISEGPLFAA
jgi:hypothetical protein